MLNLEALANQRKLLLHILELASLARPEQQRTTLVINVKWKRRKGLIRAGIKHGAEVMNLTKRLQLNNNNNKKLFQKATNYGRMMVMPMY